MCAIVDANVAHEVFGADRPEAGVKFFEWINSGIGRLVAGGKLLEELNQTPVREWARQALNAGLMRNVREATSMPGWKSFAMREHAGRMIFMFLPWHKSAELVCCTPTIGRCSRISGTGG